MANETLDFLINVLKEKESLMEKTRNITENQNIIIASQDTYGETKDLFREMNKEKQILIDAILEKDSAFQNAFSEIDQDFEQIALDYREKVIAIQKLIESVLKIDEEIRSAERKNKAILDSRKKPVQKAASRGGKKYILNQYKQNAEFKE